MAFSRAFDESVAYGSGSLPFLFFCIRIEASLSVHAGSVLWWASNTTFTPSREQTQFAEERWSIVCSCFYSLWKVSKWVDLLDGTHRLWALGSAGLCMSGTEPLA